MALLKKILYAAVSAVLALACAGCAADKNAGDFKIVTSFSPVYALTLAVTDGAANISVSNMAGSASGCIHDYQLTTADMRAVESADIFIINGSGMEDNILPDITSLYPSLKVVDSGSDVKTLLYDDEDFEECNPHTWLSVENAISQVDAIAEALAEADPANANIYLVNAAGFARNANDLLGEYREYFKTLQKRDIVLFHESFAYTAYELGLTTAAVIDEDEGAISPRRMNEVIEIIKAKGISAVFCEPQFPSASAESIAHESGAKLYNLDSLVTGTPDKDSYLLTMRENFSVIYGALS